MITLHNLAKTFGNKAVLVSINYQFEPGKTYGIVGENGAGKTTLFRCIAGLEKYTGIIDGSKTPIKNHLGYLQSEFYTQSKLTAQEYIYLLTDARNIKIDDLSKKNIFELPLNQYISTYSTGMKKKLALTALLLQKNDYFIFDEPYNGIDLQSSILFTAILKKIKNAGKTILISSHIFSTLKETCDEIILLENGRFSNAVPQAEFDNLEDFMKEKILTKNLKNLDF